MHKGKAKNKNNNKSAPVLFTRFLTSESLSPFVLQIYKNLFLFPPHRLIVFYIFLCHSLAKVSFRLKQLLRIVFSLVFGAKYRTINTYSLCLSLFSTFLPPLPAKTRSSYLFIVVVVFNIFGCLSALLIFALDFYMIIMYLSFFYGYFFATIYHVEYYTKWKEKENTGE